jgi:hypothetical protein
MTEYFLAPVEEPDSVVDAEEFAVWCFEPGFTADVQDFDTGATWAVAWDKEM